MALQQRCNHLSEAYTQLKEAQRLANKQHRAESEQQRTAYEELRQMVMNIVAPDIAVALKINSWIMEKEHISGIVFF